jgi:tetratricopeptide (TPR) repeat protein
VRSELGRTREAIDVLEVARRLRPEHLPTRLRLAEALLADGQTAPSQALFEALRKERPAEATPLYGLGRIAVLSGQRDQAIDYFRQALSIFPTYGAAHYAYGLVLRDLGQTAAARHHLTLSQEHRLERPVVDDPFLAAVAELNLGATLYLTRGRALEAAGKIDESIAAHEKALERRPGLVQAHLNLITLYGRRGQIEAAQRHYQAALAINPALPELHYNHGVLLVTRGEVRRAAEAFLETLRLNPFHPEAHHNLGVIIEQEGRLDEAAEHYRKALREKPGYRSAHFHLGRIYVNQGRVREGLAEFQAAVAPPPAASDEEAPGYFYALGATWSMVGEQGQSIAMLREALRRATLLRQKELAEAIRRDLQTLGDK